MSKQSKLTPWKLAEIFIILVCCIALGITLYDGFINSRTAEKTINDNNSRNGFDGGSYFLKMEVMVEMEKMLTDNFKIIEYKL